MLTLQCRAIKFFPSDALSSCCRKPARCARPYSLDQHPKGIFDRCVKLSPLRQSTPVAISQPSTNYPSEALVVQCDEHRTELHCVVKDSNGVAHPGVLTRSRTCLQAFALEASGWHGFFCCLMLRTH